MKQNIIVSVILCFSSLSFSKTKIEKEKLKTDQSQTSESQKPLSPKYKAIQDRKKKIKILQREITSLKSILNEKKYKHELNGSIRFASSTDSIQAADAIKPTKLNLTNSQISLSYGYLIDDHLEPFLEVSQQNITRETAEYKKTDSTTIASLGMLVNLPVADDAFSGNKFYHANWIPYLGFLFTSTSGTNESGTTSTTTVTGSSVISKLTLGTRYKLFDNVNLNFNLRVSFETNDEKAKVSTGEIGSTTNGTNFQANLFGISLLLTSF